MTSLDIPLFFAKMHQIVTFVSYSSAGDLNGGLRFGDSATTLVSPKLLSKPKITDVSHLFMTDCSDPNSIERAARLYRSAACEYLPELVCNHGVVSWKSPWGTWADRWAMNAV